MVSSANALEAPEIRPANAEWQVFSYLDLWEASDFIPTRKIEGDWSADFAVKSGENSSMRRYRAELGVAHDAWRLSLEARQDGVLNASAATLAFVRAYKQGQRPQQAASYALDASMESWSGAGLRVGRWFGLGAAHNTPRVLVSAAYYFQPQYRSARGTGEASYIDNQHYSFAADEVDANSRYQYLFRQFEPKARGYSLSLELEWPIQDALSMHYQIDDAWNRIDWQHLPELRQSLSSEVLKYDSQGYLSYHPLLQGTNQQSDKSVNVPATHTALLRYQWQQWQLNAQLRHFYGINLPGIELGHRVGNGMLSAQYDFRFKSLCLGWASQDFAMHVQADTLRLSSAKVLGLGLSYRHRF